MRLKSFLGLVEIRTKLASMIPLAIGTIYAQSHFRSFKAKNFIFLFISLLAIDMLTTALNNYFDYIRANKRHGYNYETHNVIIRDNLKEKSVVSVLIILLVVAIMDGILLFLNTDVIVLVIGAVSFAVGICYSFGPVPISRTPLGELLSGFFMGFVIIFLSVYIHVYDRGIASVVVEKPMLYLDINIMELLFIFLLSIPAVCGIANIMLANNICDIEDDIENRRYTLPVYIGRKNALRLFKSLYYIAYFDLIVLALLRLVPAVSLFALLTFIPVNRNIKSFCRKQTKKDTFSLSVKNFMLINGALIIFLGVSMILRYAVWIER